MIGHSDIIFSVFYTNSIWVGFIVYYRMIKTPFWSSYYHWVINVTSTTYKIRLSFLLHSNAKHLSFLWFVIKQIFGLFFWLILNWDDDDYIIVLIVTRIRYKYFSSSKNRKWNLWIDVFRGIQIVLCTFELLCFIIIS